METLSEESKIELSLLETTGLSFWNADDFSCRSIQLRDGRSARLFVHTPTGHGLLDPAFWESSGYYEEEYRKEFSSHLGESADCERHLKTYSSLNKRQFDQFGKFVDSETRYLEVGCSYGGVLTHVHSSGVRECVGIEPNVMDAKFTQKRNPNAKIINACLEDAVVEGEAFDLVASFEVLEHVADPISFLGSVRKALGKQGRINIEVPNHRDALMHEWENTSYANFYYHKAHIHYFTAESLQELCERAGFQGKVIGFQMYPFVNQVHWLLNHGPQKSADEALNTPNIRLCERSTQKKLNDFVNRCSEQYQTLVEDELVSDCLVFQGLKV